MTTYMASTETVDHAWYVVDAKDQTLGRLASAIATRLKGKHKPEFTPHADTGDFIVVINADKIAVTGNKGDDKLYHRHSGYIGGIKTLSFSEYQEKSPGRVLELAVKGMLPKGPLGRHMFRKLKIYSGQEHPHTAQKPQQIDI